MSWDYGKMYSLKKILTDEPTPSISAFMDVFYVNLYNIIILARAGDIGFLSLLHNGQE